MTRTITPPTAVAINRPQLEKLSTPACFMLAFFLCLKRLKRRQFMHPAPVSAESAEALPISFLNLHELPLTRLAEPSNYPLVYLFGRKSIHRSGGILFETGNASGFEIVLLGNGILSWIEPNI